jgi:hypothetical protein
VVDIRANPSQRKLSTATTTTDCTAGRLSAAGVRSWVGAERETTVPRGVPQMVDWYP